LLADARLVDALRLALVRVVVLVPLRLAVVLLRLAVLAVCVAALLLLLLLLSSFFIVKMFLSPSNFSIHWSTCVLRFLAFPLFPSIILF
jgi:hypothetical protein